MLRFYTLIIASLSCWQLVTAQEQTDSVLVSDTSANNATRHIDNDSSLTDAEKDCHMLSLTDIKKKQNATWANVNLNSTLATFTSVSCRPSMRPKPWTLTWGHPLKWDLHL